MPGIVPEKYIANVESLLSTDLLVSSICWNQDIFLKTIYAYINMCMYTSMYISCIYNESK